MVKYIYINSLIRAGSVMNFKTISKMQPNLIFSGLKVSLLLSILTLTIISCSGFDEDLYEETCAPGGTQFKDCSCGERIIRTCGEGNLYNTTGQLPVMRFAAVLITVMKMLIFLLLVLCS